MVAGMNAEWAKGSILVEPIFKQLSDLFPGVTPIDRISTHAWSHPEVRKALDATGRKKLIIAGLVTEVCLAQSVLAALKDGYEVYFVSDCSGGITTESHEDAKLRMIQGSPAAPPWFPSFPERTATGESCAHVRTPAPGRGNRTHSSGCGRSRGCW
jgi:hypothetical protein